MCQFGPGYLCAIIQCYSGRMKRNAVGALLGGKGVHSSAMWCAERKRLMLSHHVSAAQLYYIVLCKWSRYFNQCPCGQFLI